MSHEDPRKEGGRRERGRPAAASTYTWSRRGPSRLFSGTCWVSGEQEHGARPLSGRPVAETQRPPAFFTCSRGQQRPGSGWQSTSWGGCSSDLCGRSRAGRLTGRLRTRPLGEGIRAEAFPSQSPTPGSPSSHRVWLLACISLQGKGQRQCF